MPTTDQRTGLEPALAGTEEALTLRRAEAMRICEEEGATAVRLYGGEHSEWVIILMRPGETFTYEVHRHQTSSLKCDVLHLVFADSATDAILEWDRRRKTGW